MARTLLDYLNPGLDEVRAQRDRLLADTNASRAVKDSAVEQYQDMKNTAVIRAGAGATLVAFALGLWKLTKHR